MLEGVYAYVIATIITQISGHISYIIESITLSILDILSNI